MRRFTIILTCFFLAFAPTAVVAQSELDEQQEAHLLQLIKEGKGLYDQGEFSAARTKFAEAYEIYPHPDLVYRIALCHERLGEDAQAVEYYRRFLEEAPDAEERSRVEKTIEVIEARIAKSEIKVVTYPEGATVYINDVANGAAGYTPVGLPVKPGNYKLIVKMDGYETVTELVTVQAGATVQSRYHLTPAADGATGTVAKSNRGSGPPVSFVAFMVIGTGSAIASFLSFRGFSAAQTELDSKPKRDFTREQYSRLSTKRSVLLGVGLGTATLSVVSFIAAYASLRASNERATLDLGWSDAGPTVGASLRF